MNLQRGFRLPCQSASSTCCGSPAFRRPAGNPFGMPRSRTWRSGQGTGSLIVAWVTTFGPGDSFSGKLGRISIALPYVPPASDVVHKYLIINHLYRSRALTQPIPTRYHRCCFHSFGGEEEVVRGPHRPGSGPAMRSRSRKRRGPIQARFRAGEAGTAGPVRNA